VAALGVFGYGSLVLPESAGATLGRELPSPAPAALQGWRRRFSLARHNLSCEKTFALHDGSLPEWVLGLNIEPGEHPAGPVNGAVIELSEAELARLGRREIRYEMVEVSGQLRGEELPERIVTFVAKAVHFAPSPPEGAVILASYVRAVETAFEGLGPGERERYLATTGPYPVERVEAKLVKDEIPAGNPREW
jgi:cation transport regulator ChaC